MQHDPWLGRWLPLLQQTVAGRQVLEIGCGNGDDTATLVGAGLCVTAFDIDAASVVATQNRVPTATLVCQDVRDPWPVRPHEAGAVVASLSLHYFPWLETLVLMQRVQQTLAAGGVFLCRLNSTEDRHFGASGHPAIEPHYHRVDGQAKRFFNRQALDELFATGWDVLSMTHQHTNKYQRPKALWEVVARRADV